MSNKCGQYECEGELAYTRIACETFNDACELKIGIVYEGVVKSIWFYSSATSNTLALVVRWY